LRFDMTMDMQGRCAPDSGDLRLAQTTEAGMKEKAPLLVRALLVLDRVMSALWRASVMIRDEALWAWTSQPDRERTNRAIYGRLKTYLPGGVTFEEGLFDWERAAITSSSFPPSGRILLGAAGGGRELAELCKMGYEVVAFEPAPALAESARAVAFPYPESKVIFASFADIVRAARNGSGPLAPHVCAREFHGVILGWTSFSYVGREERDALLKALRVLAPRAPVLLSYLVAGDSSEGRQGRIRRWFRLLLRLTGAPALAAPGDGFQPWMGFFQTLTPEEVRSLADRTGYKPVYVKGPPAPHALFVPYP
jgi:hypothetical protein